MADLTRYPFVDITLYQIVWQQDKCIVSLMMKRKELRIEYKVKTIFDEYEDESEHSFVS